MHTTSALSPVQSPPRVSVDPDPYFGAYPLGEGARAALDPLIEHFKVAPVASLLEPARPEGLADDKRWWKGYYRAKYRTAARSGGWGTAGGRCGTCCLVRYRLGRLTVLPALCGCWNCALCGIRRAAWLKAQVGVALERYGLRFFWTLTIRASAHVDEAEQVRSFWRVKSAWNSINTHFHQEYGGYSYVWVAEATKQGIGHLHIATSLDLAARAPVAADVRAAHVARWFRGPLPDGIRHDSAQAWAVAELARLMLQATGDSFVVDCAPIASHRAADYVAKYVMQQTTARPPGLKYKRVYSKSRDVHFEPFREPSEHAEEWQRYRRPYWEAVRAMMDAGAELVRSWSEGSPLVEFRDVEGLGPAGVPLRLCAELGELYQVVVEDGG